MTRLAFLMLMLTFLSACTLRVREPSSEEKNQIINEVLALTNEIRAAAEHADVDGLFRYHSDASDIAHINNGKRYTRAALVSNYRDVYAGVEKQEINLGSPVVKVLSSDLALVVSQGSFTSTSKSGSVISGDVAWTYLWQRQQETWTLLHGHQSFPGPIARSGQ